MILRLRQVIVIMAYNDALHDLLYALTDSYRHKTPS